jgi:hypothetical protein
MKAILVVQCNPEYFIGRVSNYGVKSLHEPNHLSAPLPAIKPATTKISPLITSVTCCCTAGENRPDRTTIAHTTLIRQPKARNALMKVFSFHRRCLPFSVSSSKRVFLSEGCSTAAASAGGIFSLETDCSGLRVLKLSLIGVKSSQIQKFMSFPIWPGQYHTAMISIYGGTASIICHLRCPSECIGQYSSSRVFLPSKM